MWGDNVKEKRGLFQTIFGKAEQKPLEYSQYKLLNSWQSTFVPFTGNAWDVNLVRSAIDAFARRAATICPRHVRRGNGKINDVDSSLNRLLQFNPNPYTTAFKFYYRAAAQYKLYNNAFIYPIWGLSGRLEALYNINATSIELLEYQGEMYCRFYFATGNRYVCPYADLIHIGSHFNTNDVFGSDNRPILPVLETANTFNQSMSKFAELIAIVRGILKVQASTKTEDLNKRRDDFIRDNLKMENNGAGVIVTDSKYDYTPITDKNTPIPTGQLEYVRREIYDYFGTNDKIVQNKESPEEASSYYEGELKPFFVQLSQALTNVIFAGKERGFGNEILCEGNRLQNEKLNDKVSAAKFLTEIGAVSLDQVLNIFNLPPLGGDEGSRRVQTLNMVNAAKADEYQLGAQDEPPAKPKEPTTGGKTPEPPVKDEPTKEE
ncbi:MAG: hypothetical protein A2Y17_12260 [Clostridiales bacterium GWF2_38_85]|nr:MAG: hypothetical protein A2Y17_12260 [Clostridiales bacterium GWF2_38_85]